MIARKRLWFAVALMVLALTGCISMRPANEPAPLSTIPATETRPSDESALHPETDEIASPLIPDSDYSSPTIPDDDAELPGESVTGESPAAEPDDAATVEIPSSMELKTTGVLPYYLYTPSNPTEGMPLIVYLHGGTNKRESVEALLTTDGFPKYLYDGELGDLRAYVAVPKLDNSYRGWEAISDQIGGMIWVIVADCGVDPAKVALTGHSMGGTGTYQVFLALPDSFTCIAPMSGSVRYTEENAALLSRTMIWAFVGTEDTIISPDASRTMVQALTDRGADARITELDGATHFDVPSLAYHNSELLEWLANCGN
ncbi:MAG: dienelactone hydrolase family protein [Clostridia bacterium]|nr:dienelactone hydrolase family protein [Clostridia bacterium]